MLPYSDLKKLKKWDKNLIKMKYSVLHLGRNSPRNQHTLETSHIEHSFAAKDVGFWWTMGQQCALVVKKASGVLGNTEQSCQQVKDCDPLPQPSTSAQFSATHMHTLKKAQ